MDPHISAINYKHMLRIQRAFEFYTVGVDRTGTEKEILKCIAYHQLKIHVSECVLLILDRVY